MKLIPYFEFHKKDLEPVKSFKLQDNLNEKIWNDFQIDEEVSEQLITIAEDFYENLELPAKIRDIVLCGSLANYNWSEKYSDYDLHIIINYDEIDENFELVEKLCDYAKKVWISQHEIKVKGYEVEVYIQDEKELKLAIDSGKMGGVYSLKKSEWIKKPEKKDFELDEKLIIEKTKPLMLLIDDVEEDVKDEHPEKSLDKIKKVWDKVKKFRKSGLEEGEGSEFSTGNLVFKLLRRNGYISKVMELKREIYDKQFK